MSGQVSGFGATVAGPQQMSTVSNDVFDEGKNPVDKAIIKLNGHIDSLRNGDYFNYVQPYQHHTNVPAVGINVYSFGLKPEEHQPSGTSVLKN